MNITRKNKETNIAKLIGEGSPLPYVHTYCQTMTSFEKAEHELELPKQLATLTSKYNSAEVVEFGDGTLGIEIDGKLWAVEDPAEERGCTKGLPHEVWQYLNLAMGREIDGYRMGDTSALIK